MGRRDDSFWAEYLGVDPSVWTSAGLTVRAHAGLAGYRGLWCFRRGRRTVVSAPGAWVPWLEQRLDGLTAEDIMRPEVLESLLGENVERVVGPVFHGSLEPDAFRPCASDLVQAISSLDCPEVDRFRAECGLEEWEQGDGLDRATGLLTAHVKDGQITAMAGFRAQTDSAGDPIVLTHPAARQQGCGTAVVSAVVEAALAEDKVVLYQTLEANRGAVGIAMRLGFLRHAQHVAVRLKRESP